MNKNIQLGTLKALDSIVSPLAFMGGMASAFSGPFGSDSKPLLDRLSDRIDEKIKELEFEHEIDTLKRYFNSQDGIKTLLEMYIWAETVDVSEAMGAYDKKSKKFEFFEIRDEVANIGADLINKDKEKIFKVIADHIRPRVKKTAPIGLDNYKALIKNVRKYLRSEGPIMEAYYPLISFLKTKASVDSNNNQGICIHVHPYSGELNGYSDQDRNISQRRSSGLLEYSRKIRRVNGEPRLKIDMSLHHRNGNRERLYSGYGFDITPKITKFRSTEGRHLEMDTPKLKAFKLLYDRLLYKNIYLFPFVTGESQSETNLFGGKTILSLDMVSKEWIYPHITIMGGEKAEHYSKKNEDLSITRKRELFDNLNALYSNQAKEIKQKLLYKSF